MKSETCDVYTFFSLFYTSSFALFRLSRSVLKCRKNIFFQSHMNTLWMSNMSESVFSQRVLEFPCVFFDKRKDCVIMVIVACKQIFSWLCTGNAIDLNAEPNTTSGKLHSLYFSHYFVYDGKNEMIEPHRSALFYVCVFFLLWFADFYLSFFLLTSLEMWSVWTTQ